MGTELATELLQFWAAAKAAEGELLRADSELQRIHDWASVCRDGTLETVERYS